MQFLTLPKSVVKIFGPPGTLLGVIDLCSSKESSSLEDEKEIPIWIEMKVSLEFLPELLTIYSSVILVNSVRQARPALVAQIVPNPLQIVAFSLLKNENR